MKSQESLKSKTIKGTAWSAADAFLGQGVTFLVGIVLARLLSPDEYGLIGICLIFITILNGIVDSGFSNALIRKKNVTDTDYVPVQIINGKKYALIHKKSSNTVDISVSDGIVGKIYSLNMIYGFKYNCCGSKDNWKAMVSNNGYNFDIEFDENSRIVTTLNGVIIGAVKTTNTDLSLAELVGHTVHITTSANYKETDSTIQNLVVRVVR